MAASPVHCGPRDHHRCCARSRRGCAGRGNRCARRESRKSLSREPRGLSRRATAAVAAGALADFFELEQPTMAIAATTVRVKSLPLGVMNLRFLRSETTRWTNHMLSPFLVVSSSQWG